MKTKPPEIRENKDGTLDEVVATKCHFHLEQMGSSHWWLAVECGGKRVHVNLLSKARIIAHAEMEEADAPAITR